MPSPSPEDRYSVPQPDVDSDGIHPVAGDYAGTDADAVSTRAQAEIEEPQGPPDARTSLLGSSRKYDVPVDHNCGEDNCTHGTWSPRPRFQRGYGSFATADNIRTADGFGGPYRDDPSVQVDGVSYGAAGGALGDSVTDGLLGRPKRTGTTHWLAQRYGIKNERLMFFMYYIPCTNWIRQYKWSYLQGDLVAALTMASFYIPMALSYASNLGHIPPINGLYSFVFNPLIYAILGTCPQMVVGPEAAGSLLTGGVVREAINQGHHRDTNGSENAEIAGMVTAFAGAIILAAGLCRLGFLDSVLSRPFLRGFISAIGIVILVDQLIPEMGLDTAAAHSESGAHGSSLDKIMFIASHRKEAHSLTCAVSFSTIAIIMVMRELKHRLQPRMNWVAYIPDRFLVVVLSAVLAWKLDWEGQGLDILGDIKARGRPFQPEFPFRQHNFKHVNDAFSTAFVIALLGFFESSVAAKSLGTGQQKKRDANGKEVEADGIKNVTVSANRELVSLGVANFVGGCFMALPAFGGYGRSKVNASTGGKTPMSSVFLSLITIICVFFLLPYFYYIPKGVLSAMISVVAYSLIEEAPHDILFFWRISGWNELVLMLLIFLTTFFWNLRIGIAVGIGLSLLRLLRHATRPRIQILGRVPGTNHFENAEADEVEFIPHCLIVKIPEPLTFANTGSLKDRLRRLEDHGTNAAHPALPKVRRREHNQNVIFDVHGVTSLDPAASQVLQEIVVSYIDRGTAVFFCRVPGRRSEVWRLLRVTGIVELCGGESHFKRSVDEALRATDKVGSLMSFVDEEASIGGSREATQTQASSVFGSGRPAEQPEHDPLFAQTQALGSDPNGASR
ncbi:hypothetical protein EJ03DRAFT_267909 [Teratosphaeria nubilosa]|uniref:STAS domain-containing protein n=1 Tax=Teratosphaeria nubilosa TaxID=161662 RepID=A0A6G1LG47_9PEZI|nr:hypothetical protein EJ03DRAFT_267909 [Teratosphaeria nubilosa]